MAEKTGITPNYVSRMLYATGKPGKKNIGEDTVEVLDKCYPGWLGIHGDMAMLTAEERKLVTNFRDCTEDQKKNHSLAVAEDALENRWRRTEAAKEEAEAGTNIKPKKRSSNGN